jgi:hypothetical protein
MFRSYDHLHSDNLNKIVNKIELRLTETSESDLIHATGCKHPSLRSRKKLLLLSEDKHLVKY